MVGSDGGSEFKLHFKLQVFTKFGIKHLTTGAWNAQANAVLKHMHQLLHNCLRNFDLNKIDEKHHWDEVLSATAFAIRSKVHITLGALPAQLVFERGMI